LSDGRALGSNLRFLHIQCRRSQVQCFPPLLESTQKWIARLGHAAFYNTDDCRATDLIAPDRGRFDENL
jgi:hypothetical protein